MSTVRPLADLADFVKISVNGKTGYVGLGKINPEERLTVAGNIQLHYEDTGTGDVYIQSNNLDSAGNPAKINLNITTLNQATGSSGDIVIKPGDGLNFASTGTVKLQKKIQLGSNGTTFRRVLTGRIRGYKNTEGDSTSATILSGSGYSIANISGNTTTLSIAITFDTPMNNADYMVMASMTGDSDPSFYLWTVHPRLQTVNGLTFSIGSFTPVAKTWNQTLFFSFILVEI